MDVNHNNTRAYSALFCSVLRLWVGYVLVRQPNSPICLIDKVNCCYLFFFCFVLRLKRWSGGVEERNGVELMILTCVRSFAPSPKEKIVRFGSELLLNEI